MKRVVIYLSMHLSDFGIGVTLASENGGYTSLLLSRRVCVKLDDLFFRRNSLAFSL